MRQSREDARAKGQEEDTEEVSDGFTLGGVKR